MDTLADAIVRVLDENRKTPWIVEVNLTDRLITLVQLSFLPMNAARAPERDSGMMRLLPIDRSFVRPLASGSTISLIMHIHIPDASSAFFFSTSMIASLYSPGFDRDVKWKHTDNEFVSLRTEMKTKKTTCTYASTYHILR